jgi:hypothetical protein
MESEIRRRQSVRAGIGVVLLLGAVAGSSACRSFPLTSLVTIPRQLRSPEACPAPPREARLVPSGQRYSGPGLVEPRQSSATIPEGTRIEIELDRELSSLTACAGDLFQATLAKSVVLNGQTVLAEGTKVTGLVVGVTTGARWRTEGGSLALTLNSMLADEVGAVVPLVTEPLTVKRKTPVKEHLARAGIVAAGLASGFYVSCREYNCEGAGLFGIGFAAGGVVAYDTPRVRALVLEPRAPLAFRLAEDVLFPAR